MAIDFRVRPPFRGFRAAFGPRNSQLPDETLMDEFNARLDRAGITRAVAVGRFVPADSRIMAAQIPNEDVAALVAAYPGRYEGFGSVDVRDVHGAVAEVDRIAELGLKGVAFDNPLSIPARYDDDEALFPIYERVAHHGLIAAITSSGMIGHDISYANPVHLQRVGVTFPELTIVVPHGSWPWTTQIAAVLVHSLLSGRSRIYILPDVYQNSPNTPGGRDYADAARWGLGGHLLSERILFASSYPAQDPIAAITHFRTQDVGGDDAQQRILQGNAEALLAAVPSRTLVGAGATA